MTIRFEEVDGVLWAKGARVHPNDSPGEGSWPYLRLEEVARLRAKDRFRWFLASFFLILALFGGGVTFAFLG